MTTAAIYTRVSTREQADKGTSLDTQVEAGLTKAAELGWHVPPDLIIKEDGTGKDLGRPGLLRLFDLATSRRIEGVIFHTPDRLYRPANDGDEWRVFEVLDRFQKAGVEVAWVDATIPSEGPLASVFMFLDSWRSGRERRQMVERSVRGIREKARRGRLVNTRSLPKWLRYEEAADTVELDEEWAQVGRLIFSLVADENLSLRAVSKRLKSLGVPAPQGAAVWSPTTIRNWLSHTAAKGEIYQLRFDTSERGDHNRSSRRLRPVDESFLLKVPALVSPEVWDAVHRQLARNQELAARNTRRQYLLRGLVVCGSCNRHMAGYSQSEKQYYRCASRAQKRIDHESCGYPLAKADELEPGVWDAITGLLKDPQRLREQLRNRHENGSATREVDAEQLRIARKRLKELPAEQDRLVEGYGKGLIPDDRMAARMEGLGQESEELTSVIRDLETKLSRLELTTEQEESAIKFAERVNSGLENLDFEGRQQLIRLLVEDVTCHPDRAIVRTIVPTDGPDDEMRLCSADLGGRVGTRALLVRTVVMGACEPRRRWVNKRRRHAEGAGVTDTPTVILAPIREARRGG